MNTATEYRDLPLNLLIRVNSKGERKISLMRWGFKREDGKLLFNARAESINDVSFWKKSFSLRRCIVPADSFFEWQKTEEGKKPKFEFTIRGGKTFGMAGLWAPWRNPKTNQWEDTFAIVTVEANETMAPIHDRQPAILALRDYPEYLENAERPPIHLLRVFPDDEMKAEEIGREPISNKQANLLTVNDPKRLVATREHSEGRTREAWLEAVFYRATVSDIRR